MKEWDKVVEKVDDKHWGVDAIERKATLKKALDIFVGQDNCQEVMPTL